jgi:hypothetical protein
VLAFMTVFVFVAPYPTFLHLDILYFMPKVEARCWWRSCLKHYATSWKVEGLISGGVTGIFSLA